MLASRKAQCEPINSAIMSESNTLYSGNQTSFHSTSDLDYLTRDMS
jgi:hypothetical protein